MEVDSSGGDAGGGGIHGKPGGGGAPGAEGKAGQPAVWQVQVENGFMRHQGRAGRAGKRGKPGKNGRPLQTKPAKKGKAGEDGVVSFCLYDETGMIESSGTPYRPVVLKREAAKLFPVPVLFGKRGTRRDEFFYGTQLYYGKVLPVNTGGLGCPQFFIAGTLICYHDDGNQSYTNTTKLPYPPIPPASATRNGTLPPTAAQEFKIKLPTLAESGFKLNSKFPWNEDWSSPSSKHKAKFVMTFEVEGFKLRPSDHDSGHICGSTYDITLNIPVEPVKIQGTQWEGRAITLQPSIGLANNSLSLPTTGNKGAMTMNVIQSSEVEFTFAIRNNMFQRFLTSSSVTYTVHIVARRFSPELIPIEPTASPNATGFKASGPEEDSEKDYHHARYTDCVPEIEKSGAAQFKFKLKLNPEKNDLLPGAQIMARVEINIDDTMAIFSSPTHCRLAPPLPPRDPGIVQRTDVLFMAHPFMQIEDFQALSQCCDILKLKVYFLDVQHYCNPQTGSVDPGHWAAQMGKSIIVWTPPTQAIAKLVSNDDLKQHVSAGGGLIDGLYSTFKIAPSRSYCQAKRAVRLGKNLFIGELKEDITKKCKVGSLIEGQAMKGFIARLIAAIPVYHKLHLLMTDPQLSQTVLGTSSATLYEVHKENRCCGGAPKEKSIVPMAAAPCTLFDLVVASLTADIILDIEGFKRDRSYQNCNTIHTIVSFAKKCVGGSSGQGTYPGQCAAGIAASIMAAALDEPKKISKEWMKTCSAESLLAFNQCTEALTSLSANYFPPALAGCSSVEKLRDFKSLAQRIRDLRAINGLSIPTASIINPGSSGSRNTTDIGFNTALHMIS